MVLIRSIPNGASSAVFEDRTVVTLGLIYEVGVPTLRVGDKIYFTLEALMQS